jgi:hypothetical protein
MAIAERMYLTMSRSGSSPVLRDRVSMSPMMRVKFTFMRRAPPSSSYQSSARASSPLRNASGAASGL